MNVPNWLLMDVVAAEVVLLAAAWLIILIHGARTMMERRREPWIAEARDLVVQGMLAGSLPEGAGRELDRLSRRERVRLFKRVAPNLRGVERAWLGELAEELGLIDFGRRLSRSRFWWRRLRGTRLLTLTGGAQDAVLPLADDSSPLVRSQVAEWCGSHPSGHAVDTLIGMLGDRSQAGRFAVQDALIRIGTPAIEPLAEALRKMTVPSDRVGPAAREDEIRAGLAVARGLGDRRLAEAVLRLSEHPSAAVRAAAFRALGSAGGEEAARRLVDGLDDPDARARTAAASALGELGHWQAAPQLARSLGDTAWDVRSAAGRALVRIGPPGEILLRRALRSDDRFVSDMARHAMDTAAVVTRFGGR